MIVHQRERDAKRDALAEAVFCTLRTSGPDPTCDTLTALVALLAPASGVARRFELACANGECDARSAWREFEAFVGGRDVIVADAESFDVWRAAYGGAATAEGTTMGVCDLAALAFPGRRGRSREDFVRSLAPDPAPRSELLTPEDVRVAANELVRRFREQAEPLRALALRGFDRARRGLATAGDDRAARRLEFAAEVFADPAIVVEAAGGDLLADVDPENARAVMRWFELEKLPPDRPEIRGADTADLAFLDELFHEHLPAAIAEESGQAPYVRGSQCQVANEVARTLGSEEILLIHAPTGTGKTLAYLLPAMLFAQRNGLRVGVATYTRALQEQAMDREVPRALRALAYAGHVGSIRVVVLKGRDNYLCWRALALEEPDEDDEAEVWLAWLALALFGASDMEGDLDRLPRRSPLPLADPQRFTRALERLLAAVRCRTGCCRSREDRYGCGAENALRRAEKSHVVITNHSFALARQEFLAHVVFDECEHLHDQAHNAWSHRLRFEDLRETLAALHVPRRRASRAALDRIAAQLLEGTPSFASLEEALDCWRGAARAVEGLRSSVEAFRGWRNANPLGHTAAQEHAGFRDWILQTTAGAEAVNAKRITVIALEALEAGLAELEERLDGLHLRRGRRLRQTLERARRELAERIAALHAWLPIVDGQPTFATHTFHDVEEDLRGEPLLCARVLLPNEYLGRHYWPTLRSAVVLSATTWLAGGFDASRGYLGLDRAATPAEDEERRPCLVRTFRAADVFDWRRVLVAVPRDAPDVKEKRAFLEFARSFLMRLAETTRGRMLVLATNADDVRALGQSLAGHFRARRIPLYWQGMSGIGKEELGELFRERIDSVLIGVDTFWYGADFPGRTLEYVVVLRLPYGVPDRYHHAQCAALGNGSQRSRIYLPRALAKLRQGFGRLMRRESDRGVVFVLDKRILSGAHKLFLRELPLRLREDEECDEPAERAHFVSGDANECIERALVHMELVPPDREDMQERPILDSPRDHVREAIDEEDVPF